MGAPPLLPEQLELLAVLVEASRSVPSSERQPFFLLEHMGGTTLVHQGLAKVGRINYHPYTNDAKELASRGLIRLEVVGDGAFNADVTADGLHFYETAKAEGGKPVGRIEAEMRSYIDSEAFARRHPASLAKWQQAQAALWSADAGPQMTMIGHLCREAMQAFATEALGDSGAVDVEQDPQRTVNRIRAALNVRIASRAVRQLLDALLDYWRSVNDLVQRQEHGAAKEGSERSWEDARRVVFQTLIVMHEIDRALG